MTAVTYQLGPGPMTPAVRAIVITNVSVFVVMLFARALGEFVGLVPERVITSGFLWQVVTYQFVHFDVLHLLFNMLWVWMFGVDLERRWGPIAFSKYYLVVGTTAGLATVVTSLLPLAATAPSYTALTVGASGAGYGLMMAWAIVFPHRTVYFFGLVPLTARTFALIAGGISLAQAISSGGTSGIAHVAHLAGLVAGWFYLKTPRPRPRPSPPRPDYIRRVH